MDGVDSSIWGQNFTGSGSVLPRHAAGSISGPPTAGNTPYTLTLDPAGFPTTDTARHWLIIWGDGTVQQLPPTATSASHLFETPGQYTIGAVLVGQSIGYAAGQLSVKVSNLRLGGDQFVRQGEPYTLEVAYDGLDEEQMASWSVNWGDGSPAEGPFTAPTLSRTHTFASTPAMVTVTATDTFGRTHTATLNVDVPPAAPTSLTVSNVSATHADLAWADNAAGEDGYLLEGSVNGGPYGTVAELPADTTAFAFDDLLPNAATTFRVSAYSGIAVSSPSKTAAANALPAAPEDLMATESGTAQIDLDWTSLDGLTSYRLERRVNGGS